VDVGGQSDAGCTGLPSLAARAVGFGTKRPTSAIASRAIVTAELGRYWNKRHRCAQRGSALTLGLNIGEPSRRIVGAARYGCRKLQAFVGPRAGQHLLDVFLT
jgi:hypothetical protein